MTAPSESSADHGIAATKAAMRRDAMALRAGLDPRAGEALAEHVLRDLALTAGATIAGVWPLPGEIDLRPLLHALHAAGHRIALPHTPPRGQALIFRYWQPDCVMLQDRFGTWRPDGPILEPDILFVPLLAFDRRGHRLGYGGGYYDRTLAALPGRLAIGFAHAAQEVPCVPVGPHDRPLSVIATERAIIDLR